ncbi:glucosaminidase domain-containing protein [Candidatus Woesebacteria bacterium]|nr:glucosaminidase domain-containing protein [Candidatus Woesebacteria bacterium]
MVKYISIVLLLIVLLVIPKIVSAESVAGDSATLKPIETIASNSSLLSEQNIQRSVIREILSERASPLESEVDAFMDACITHDIDCYLLPSIAGLESSFGKFIYPDSHNPFGWGGGLIMFESWSEGFQKVAFGLKKNYIGRGATTIEEMAPIYAASPTWAVRVRSIHNQFVAREEEKRRKLSMLSVLE